MFGIGPSSREYQRWRGDDGFRQVDFEGVLNESGAVLVVDWREWLQDAVVVILRLLQELGITAAAIVVQHRSSLGDRQVTSG